MGKNPNRAAAAARAAEMRAQAARKEKQRRQMITAVVAVVVVIIAVVVGVVIANRPEAPKPAADTAATTALAKLTTLPASTLDSAPAPAAVPKKLNGGTPLTADGKPKVLYIGAEYCPYCAMERWALIGALSRFGTFSGLKPTTSSSTDTFPDTPTWSFVGSTYKSDHVVLEAVETKDREGKPIQELTGENLALFQKFNPQGGIPWISYGGTHATDGATVNAALFEGATYNKIIAGVLDPTSEIGKSVDAQINAISAQLCTLTKGQPTNVCTSKAVMTATPLLEK